MRFRTWKDAAAWHESGMKRIADDGYRSISAMRCMRQLPLSMAIGQRLLIFATIRGRNRDWMAAGLLSQNWNRSGCSSLMAVFQDQSNVNRSSSTVFLLLQTAGNSIELTYITPRRESAGQLGSFPARLLIPFRMRFGLFLEPVFS
jgi:hypothetical protein